MVERAWRLQEFRQPVRCPTCGLWQALSPTTVPSWDANCEACFRHSSVLSAYADGALWRKVSDLKGRFLEDRWDDAAERELRAASDELGTAHECECGAHFTLAARPRCRRCTTVLSDTFFRFVTNVLLREDDADLERLKTNVNRCARSPNEVVSKAIFGDSVRTLAYHRTAFGEDAVRVVLDNLSPAAMRELASAAIAAVHHTRMILPDAPLRSLALLEGIDPRRTGKATDLP